MELPSASHGPSRCKMEGDLDLDIATAVPSRGQTPRKQIQDAGHLHPIYYNNVLEDYLPGSDCHQER